MTTDKIVAANKEATEPRVPGGLVEVISSTWLTFTEYLYDNEYVLFVIITVRLLSNSWLVSGPDLQQK